ncbi:ribonuclease [Trichodelitschia bisporula]|uniref:ribonuclease T1 n=1 Tax=Trichodelitschia bisporula TaxID=703511 RepID=A0A6G1HPW8_9PEZI|nr:ribonuclease [Trichodelitschia bisporula]
MLFLAVLSVALSAFALPTSLTERADITCGKSSYTSTQIAAAAQAACNYVQTGDTAGSSTYPHVYRDEEGFTFAVAGPYYEFPLLKGGKVYTGGSPGPDRVVVNAACGVGGEITHSGASGNKFVGCLGTA